MTHFWTEEDYRDLEASQSFGDLVPIACNVIKRMSPPVAIVCGPISTGGRGSIEANRHYLQAAINLAYEKGHHTFDQNPFENKLQQLKLACVHEGYCVHLLEDFYLKVFESGLIHKMYFLPDWQTSTGARWEREVGQRLGIEILDYPAEWLKELSI